MHRGDTARVDAAALRAAALPSSLGRPSASSGSAQGSSRAETHHAAAAACAVSGRAAYSQVFITPAGPYNMSQLKNLFGEQKVLKLQIEK